MPQSDESDALAALEEAIRTLSNCAFNILRAADGGEQHMEEQGEQHIKEQMGAPLSPAPPIRRDEEDLFASVLLRLKRFEAAGKQIL